MHVASLPHFVWYCLWYYSDLRDYLLVNTHFIYLFDHVHVQCWCQYPGLLKMFIKLLLPDMCLWIQKPSNHKMRRTPTPPHHHPQPKFVRPGRMKVPSNHITAPIGVPTRFCPRSLRALPSPYEALSSSLRPSFWSYFHFSLPGSPRLSQALPVGFVALLVSS